MSAFVARFKIGEAFPADDPAARFVTMLAVICNDVVRTASELLTFDAERSPEEQARQVKVFRTLAASHFEAVDFVRQAERRNREVIAKLLSDSPDGRAKLDRLLAATDPRSEHYVGDWLKGHRNTTYHYASVDPNAVLHGNEDVFKALTTAADATSTIEAGERVIDLRFRYADQVVLEWLPSPAEQERMLNRIMVANNELVLFTQFAIAEYLRSLPAGIVTYEQ